MNKQPLILFIEDNEKYASLIVDYLRSKKDYEVVWAKDYREASAAVARNRQFDVIVTDIELPGGVSGDMIAKMLDEKGYLRSTPVLISSGLYDEHYFENKGMLEAFKDSVYIDFCEKSKTKWLIFKIGQMLKIRALALDHPGNLVN